MAYSGLKDNNKEKLFYLMTWFIAQVENNICRNNDFLFYQTCANQKFS